MYKHRNVWTRHRGDPHLQGGAVASSRTPTDCRHSTGQGAPARVFSLEAQGLLLVPRPWSLSLSKNPLFSMFTTAAQRPHCSSVFALSFISFPLLLRAQNVFTVRKMLMIMLSVWCVHGEKKQNTRAKKKELKIIKCLQVLWGGTGDDDTA